MIEKGVHTIRARNFQENTRISVIVPVYNAEEFLYDSLGNLVNQTFRTLFPHHGMEVICVDDASTDRSLQILHQCQSQFPDIVKVLHQDQNRGPGAARNRGLEMARGQYIGFMDADDLIDVTMYEKLYVAAGWGKIDRNIEEMADVADCAIETRRGDWKGCVLYTSPDYFGRLDDDGRSQLIATPGSIATRIFKRTLIEEDAVRFRECEMMEDLDFLRLLLAKASSCAGVKEVLYLYLDHKSSVSYRPYDCIFSDYENVIQATYNRLSPLPNYEGLRAGTEFAMLELADRCLYDLDQMYKGKHLSTATKEQYKARLRDLLDRVIQIPPRKNPFILEKMGDEMKTWLFRFYEDV